MSRVAGDVAEGEIAVDRGVSGEAQCLLAGVTAAETILPVIGVPIDSSPLSGLDALLATVQMPPGVPVSTMGVGKSGAINAAILTVEILALSDEDLARKLIDYKAKLTTDAIGRFSAS